MIKRNRLKPVRPDEPILPSKQTAEKTKGETKGGRNLHNKKEFDSAHGEKGAGAERKKS